MTDLTLATTSDMCAEILKRIEAQNGSMLLIVASEGDLANAPKGAIGVHSHIVGDTDTLATALAGVFRKQQKLASGAYIRMLHMLASDDE
jgi:hypothetical protein